VAVDGDRDVHGVCLVRQSGHGHQPFPKVVEAPLRFASRPDPGHGGQVVRADRRHRVVRPFRGRRVLEPHEPVRERALLLELLADDRLDQPQVLADHKGVGAAALVREQRQQSCGWVLHVRAQGGDDAFGNPEQAEQAHHVVEPDAGRVPPRASNRVDERLPARVAERPWVEGRKAPILAVAEELVGRRADAHARRQVVLPAPRVESVGSKAHGHVRDQADLS